MTDKAVLCGINDYQSISDLRGCENDLDGVRQLLIDSYQFDPAAIRTYANEEVVGRTIDEAFDWLAQGSQPGDRLVFHFSGHGSYTSSKSSQKDVDELLCLYDMDWEKENSFIRDTDLGALTRRVDSGARLTVILDSCHSGSGTRGVTAALRAAARVTSKTGLIIVQDTANQLAKQRGAAVDHAEGLVKARAGTMRMLKNVETPPVYARFVEPPAKIQEAVKAGSRLRVRTLGESMRSELNHQLLAAAHEKQTAADAFIDGDYRGAFSFYLCDAAQSDTTDSCDVIMQRATQQIKSAGYGQDPQTEGPFGSERLFGGEAAPSASDDTTLSGQEKDQLLTVSGLGAAAMTDFDSSQPCSQPQPLETLNHLLRVSEKLIDLALPVSVPARPAAVTGRSSADEVIVYVHGINQHPPGFSVKWHNAILPHLSHNIRRAEVRWSQHVNARDVVRSAARKLEMEALEAQVRAELERRMERLDEIARRRSTATGRTAAPAMRVERPRSFLLDDFIRYMLIAATRELILNEFTSIVTPELTAGRNVHVVSHSWGTVVAYEGMRRFDSQSLPGRVANLFVVGSALSIGAVQSNLFGRVTDGRAPKLVDRIVNLDAGGDVIGGAIGDEFTVDREFLGLFPTNCRTIPFTSIAINPACAHRSYFESTNRAVNRDIFAEFINQT